MRRLSALTIFVCVFLIAARAPLPPTTAVRTPLTGIFAVKEFAAGKDASFASSVFENPSVTGVAARIGWGTLEPTEGAFRWEPLDAMFTRAAAAGKAVALIIVPGFETPAWALEHVQTASFGRKYGRDKGEVERLPLPWDATYLARWSAFLKQVADRYGHQPQFRLIGAAGPTSLSVEMSLPNTPEDLTEWIRLGYSPAKFIASWQQVFQTYSRLFPDQYMSLALYPGLPINRQGRSDHTERVRTRQAIVDLGLAYPTQFALQTSGLNASKEAGAESGDEIVRSYSGRIATGFQLSTAATRNPEKMGDASNPVNALRASIAKGLVPNDHGARIRYLQIYEPDVINPDMQPVLVEAAKVLAGGKSSLFSSTPEATKPRRRKRE
jgi:hypothetical protein